MNFNLFKYIRPMNLFVVMFIFVLAHGHTKAIPHGTVAVGTFAL